MLMPHPNVRFKVKEYTLHVYPLSGALDTTL